MVLPDKDSKKGIVDLSDITSDRYKTCCFRQVQILLKFLRQSESAFMEKRCQLLDFPKK